MSEQRKMLQTFLGRENSLWNDRDGGEEKTRQDKTGQEKRDECMHSAPDIPH
jgi:hypothetical protein